MKSALRHTDLWNADVLVMILAGGEGTRLAPLTQDRAKPAVPFAGHYRIIDFVLSNFVNSGFYHIKVLTQYKSDSLNKHISRGWRLSSMLGNYIEVVPPQMRTGREWFKGSADAIFQNMNIITDEKPKYVCVFGADHIYKMDVRQMMAFHLRNNAACTIAALPVPASEASGFGIMHVDKNSRIIDWCEKPKNPPEIPGRPGWSLSSMGNYIFNIDTLLSAIQEDSARSSSNHDFGKDIIPTLLGNPGLMAYDFTENDVPGMGEKERGYWRDVGDIDAYWHASMDLVSVSPIMNIHNRFWPILSHTVPAPPAKFVFADEETMRIGIATDSLVCEGVIISGGRINRSILSPFVRINSYSHVEESILMDDVDIGRYAKVRRAIIDKGVKVPQGVVIGYDRKEDRKRFDVSKGGIVVVPKGTVIA